METIAGRIINRMVELDMSYGELSRATGIPKSALQRYATGETTKIPIDRLEKIAKALNKTPAYLMGWAAEGKTGEQIAKENDAILEAYRKASPEIQQAIQRILGNK